MIALEPGKTGAWLRTLGAELKQHHGTPSAIVAVSAHSALPSAGDGTDWDVVLLGAGRHAAVYDFGGFSPELNRLRYDAPGAPALAERTATLLTDSGWRAAVSPQGGLDHGIWTSLRYAFPEAEIPVLPLVWPARATPERLFMLGAALAPLAEDGVLIWATGSITHNLRLVFSQRQAHGAPADDMPEIAESRAFRDWWADRSRSGDQAALFNWQQRAPHARDMHPTDEHLLPWFVAAGAAHGLGMSMDRVHQGVTFGCLGMDAYEATLPEGLLTAL